MNDDPQAQLLAVFKDRNLRFPSRPRLAEDISMFRMPDGLGMQFRGGEAPVVVRGRYAEPALDFLLSALDGTCGVEGLVSQCPEELPKDAMLQTLWLLFTKGLLVESDRGTGIELAGCSNAPAISSDPSMRRQLLFWGRNLDATRSAGSAAQIQRRLETCRIVLVGTGMFGLTTYDLLSRSGCKDICVLGWDDDGLLQEVLTNGAGRPRLFLGLPTTSVDEAIKQLKFWVQGADLIVTATRHGPQRLFEAINRICLTSQCPWVRGDSEGNRIEVGPYFRPYESACFRCMVLRECSVRELAIEEQLYQDHLAQPRPSGSGQDVGEALYASTLGASLLVGEVVRAITCVCPPALINRVLKVSALNSVDFKLNHILRVPRCPECYRGSVPPPHDAAADK